MDTNVVIYVLSDSIGETGEQVARAAASQFNSGKYEIRRFPYITDEEQIVEIFEEAKEEKSILVFTVVIERLKRFIIMKAKEYEIPAVDLMTPVLDSIQTVVGFQPKRESGLIRRLDEQYFKKVEAVEFAVKYDDGKDTRGIKKADIILVGVSRTSKTPLSMYLAHKHYKVANVPLVPEVPAPDELFEKDTKRVFGLIANPFKLNEIRQERLRSLGLSNNANYASIDRIEQELEYSKQIMERLQCKVIDVSNKAVEETAGIIIDIMKENFGED
ncbi:kinase/pyrophosphorylase [Anaerosalibacter bizertensis]|uniref:Putative pyruvate, phosphate dikinase regulatory protein n=1 Tax=Anaerosalibacter bizertensis TaxID=932217 RepID=A0A9Q4FML2_9FIRM|nr:pyruvate, water dikinase regulatory protein [Anaerosalibacter bizertensis]MBV1819712.1 kinase/pyrophosphorylase [Bacteroidales bacterium MSK.15.36]MBU5293994.1 kinase/pyrophosphorylase [Anaerosalibacter bizertensis]MCB5560287.1 kinase/pyrophosphorylase [Anaerosalibacter bizertensis]MCG4565897.1 kinase/pyrophosphorylase [Anaerosalibacter bizertensis]MCG4583182.1 kinase/pyrophosphorylase [Anaerosalibacter bizertensis]